MKKNKLSIFFVILVFLICAIPFVCMSFAATTVSTENRRLAQFPSFSEDGSFNVDFLSDLGAYFEDHFAFKNLTVAADGQIQSWFGVSAVDTVVKGKDGWLYYTASTDDFQGLNVMSDQEAANAVHNIRLMENYVKMKGASFVFTVAPNKNSLYPEYMPYYYKETSLENNMTKLAPVFSEDKTYADLFSVFRNEEETLYMKRDSHWNNKGALLASNILLDAAKKDHDAFESVSVLRKKDAIGDLGRMAYSVWAPPEWNYTYSLPGSFSYSQTDDVEAALVVTENKTKKGSLLMFRDSFANTLIPIISESYGNAVYSKALPYPLERYFEDYKPDTVIAEKVERNLRDFSRTPPIMSAPEVALSGKKTDEIRTGTTLQISRSLDDAQYYCVSGTLSDVESVQSVYIQIGDTAYDSFMVSNDDTDLGYLLYLKQEVLGDSVVSVSVIADCDGTLKNVYTGDVDLLGGLEG